jgi:protein-S-isoprenylcysteine O-methyltransferase Ste14
MSDLVAKGGWWVAAQLVMFLVVAAALVWGGSTGAHGGWVVAGITVAAAGVGLALDGVRRIRRHITALPAPVPGAPLIDSGSFALVRHPIYGGLAVAALGLAVARAAPLGIGAAVGLAWFFALKSSREEQMLEAVYPAYAEYKSRVTRKLIPWVL